MKFGLFQEGDVNRGASNTMRFKVTIREVQYAEETGFDVWGCSEQHFVGPACTTSAPEVLYGAMAQATSKITLRTMTTVMLGFIHSIRIAERLAMIDVLSNGRLQLGAVRGNDAHVVDAFQVDASDTLAEWNGTDAARGGQLRRSTQETLQHKGNFY